MAAILLLIGSAITAVPPLFQDLDDFHQERERIARDEFAAPKRTNRIAVTENSLITEILLSDTVDDSQLRDLAK